MRRDSAIRSVVPLYWLFHPACEGGIQGGGIVCAGDAEYIEGVSRRSGIKRRNVQGKTRNRACAHGRERAGKSTLMKCLFGIYKPDEGDIYLNGAR